MKKKNVKQGGAAMAFDPAPQIAPRFQTGALSAEDSTMSRALQYADWWLIETKE